MKERYGQSQWKRDRLKLNSIKIKIEVTNGSCGTSERSTIEIDLCKILKQSGVQQNYTKEESQIIKEL